MPQGWMQAIPSSKLLAGLGGKREEPRDVSGLSRVGRRCLPMSLPGSGSPEQTALHAQPSFLTRVSHPLLRAHGQLSPQPRPAPTPDYPRSNNSLLVFAPHQETTQVGFSSGLLGRLLFSSRGCPELGRLWFPVLCPRKRVLTAQRGNSAPCLPFPPHPRLGLHWLTEGGCSAPPWGFDGTLNQRTPNPTLPSVSSEASFLLLTASAGNAPTWIFCH